CAEPRAALPFFLANLLAQHSGVVPAEAQLRIRCVTTEHPQRLGALRIVVQKDVAFFAFDQGEHVDVVVHDLDSIHSGRGAGGWPTLAGLFGAGGSRVTFSLLKHPMSQRARLDSNGFIRNPTTATPLAFLRRRRAPR